MKLIHCHPERHAPAILAIFNEAILHSTALYEYVPRSLQTIYEWFADKESHDLPIFGIENEDGQLMGFASFGPFRPRRAYKYSAEHSIYVDQAYRGRGVAKLLMQALLKSAQAHGIHTLIGYIDQQNRASIALHEKYGFTHAGTLRQAGFKFGQWLDLAFYQLILDTPSHPIDG